MKSRIEHVMFTVLMAVFLCGCGQNVNGLGTEDDVKAIRKLFDDFCQAHRYDDGAKLAEFYTDDAMLMPSDEPIVSGKAAIASRYQQDIEKFTAELTTIPDEIEVSGNLAFVRGAFTIKLTPKAEGEKIEAKFKAVSILRKDADGSWKLYCDIWNSDARMPPKNEAAEPPHEFELMPADNATKVSEGVYRVGWIKAFLSDNESRAQMIPVEMKEPYVYWLQWGLERQDVNFDGYVDIAVREHGGAKWGRWYWYLYDPKKMEFYTNTLTKELSELTCASFRADPETKRITVTQFFGADLTEYAYQIIEGDLRLCGSRRIHAGSHAERNEAGGEFHTSPDRWERPRTYHTAMTDISYDEKIAFNRTQPIEIEGKRFSENGAYWFALMKRVDENLDADESLYVFNERDYVVRIDVSGVDHRYGSRAKWINEKLIYYQWWWGRVLGGYMVFDVEREDIVQKEFVKYGGNAFQQFQQAKNR